MNYTDKFLPLSFSSLKAFAESPRSFVHYKEGKRITSPAMLKGTLIHRRILEPAAYAHTVEVWEGKRAGKAWTEYKEAQAGKDIVTRSENEVIQGAYFAVQSHPIAKELIDGCTDREAEVTWELDGLPFRGYVDGYNENYALDIKTAPDVSYKGVERAVWSMKYFMQAALYRQALKAQGIALKAYYVISVQAVAPHNVAVYRLSEAYMNRGDQLASQLVRDFKAWDGKPTHDPQTLTGAITMSAPGYAPATELDTRRDVY
jgi:hypothetical protein